MLRFLVSLSIFLATLTCGNARNKDFLIRIWQSDEGLPGNVVRSLGQTPDGFLWIATAEGLARFNGLEFEFITPADTEASLPLRLVRVFTPANGSVWVATSQGGLLRVKHNRLERLLEDNSGKSQDQLITQLISIGETIYFFRDGRIWTLDTERQPIPVSVPEITLAMTRDAQAQAKRGRTQIPSQPNQLTDRTGGTWKIENGFLAYKTTEDAPLQIPLSEKVEAQDFLEDQDGNVWLASPIQGLIRFRHSRVKHFETSLGPYQSPTKTALQTRDGTWWIANRNGGLDRIRHGELTHIGLLSHGEERLVVCLFEDRSNRLWVCTQNGSVYQIKNDALHRPFSGMPELSQISAITEDREGALWLGGKQRLFRWNGLGFDDFSNHPLLQKCEFSHLTQDSSGKIYLGTTDGRVFTYDQSAFTLLKTLGVPGKNRVSGILVLPSGEIWVSTIGSGLHVYQNSYWQSIGKDLGLPDDRLTAIAYHQNDTLWMGSLGGILMVHRSELIECLRKNHPPHWLRLDRSDGLKTRECAGEAQPGVFQSADHHLWFPTASGLTGIDPEEMPIQRNPPRITFDHVGIDGRAYEPRGQTLTAGPGHSRLAFHFTGLSLDAPEKVTYQVKLAGLETEYRSIDTFRFANYESVPPGNYTFEVLARNGDGFQTPSPASIHILIKPHFWQTLPFILSASIGALCIALGIGWFISRQRSLQKINALKIKSALEAERSRISRDLHDDLGASLTELSLRSMISAKTTNEALLRPTIEQLVTDSKQLVEMLDEIVWATNPTKDSLRSLLEYSTFFARRFLSSTNTAFHVDLRFEIPDVTIGPRRRHHFLLALREALNNTVKHARASNVFIRFGLENGELRAEIRDDGRGFKRPPDSFGNGLGNMQHRMTEIKGRCLIESTPNAGTTVTLIMPITSTQS
ncbi:MAG: two-component regulator propeller domain-containing protein [Luteolibacter sp.]